MTDCSNKVVLLTGAGGGIGSAIAEKLAKMQMKVVLFGGNNLEKLQATQTIVEQYSECLVLPGDLNDLEFVKKAITQAAEAMNGIDVLVNNAGVAQNIAFENVTVEEFDRIMAINNRTPYFLTQQVLPYLKKSAAATVINIASIVAHHGYPLQSVYSASKHAMLGWTKSLAREYYKENIRVHAICPGGVYTDMVKLTRPDLTSEGMIMPADIADIVSFFLTNRGNAVVDEILVHRVSKEPF